MLFAEMGRAGLLCWQFSGFKLSLLWLLIRLLSAAIPILDSDPAHQGISQGLSLGYLSPVLNEVSKTTATPNLVLQAAFVCLKLRSVFRLALVRKAFVASCQKLWHSAGHHRQRPHSAWPFAAELL